MAASNTKTTAQNPKPKSRPRKRSPATKTSRTTRTVSTVKSFGRAVDPIRQIDRLGEVAKKNGWPAFLLLLGILAGWRFVDWARPIAEEIVRGHITTLSKMSESMDTQTRTLEGVSKNNDKIVDQTSRIAEITARQNEQLNQIHQAVVKPPVIIVPTTPMSVKEQSEPKESNEPKEPSEK